MDSGRMRPLKQCRNRLIFQSHAREQALNGIFLHETRLHPNNSDCHGLLMTVRPEHQHPTGKVR